MAPRKPRAPGAMLEMASPEILARMEKPEEPKPVRRMRLSKGFEKNLRQSTQAKIVPTATPAKTDENGDPFEEARKPQRGLVFKVGELDDYTVMKPLPANGKCTCGSRPYSWTDARGFSRSKHNTEIAAFCSHVAHGGNGKFWLFSGEPLKPKRGRPRKHPVEIAQ